MSLKKSNDDGSSLVVPAQSGEVLSAAGNARRRFTRRAGVGSAGVLLTLASQSGMATGPLTCVAPSRHMSLSKGVSARTNTGVSCTGVGPLVWANPNCYWPAGVSKTAYMRDAFPTGSSSYAGYKLLDVVRNGVDCTKGTVSSLDALGEFGRALVTAYLNVKAKNTSFLNEEVLGSMYAAMTSTMLYRVDATTTWDMAALTDYLKKTYS